MKFSICLATLRADELGGAVASVRRQTYTDWELVVVGQGDDDAVRVAALAAGAGDPRVRFEHIDERGLSRARNAAIRRSDGDVVVFMDDDCEASPGWLATIATCLTQDPTIGLVGGATVAPPPPRRRPRNCPEFRPADVVYDPHRQRRIPPAGWDWGGGNVAIRREVVRTVGLLDEHLGAGSTFPSCEDTDYKLRLESLGVRMRTTPDALVVHTHGWRVGVRALWSHQRNYARGNGAMAGKLTLQGDQRGRVWLRDMRALATARWWGIPSGVRRYVLFRAAYLECVRGYCVDERGMLTRRTATGSDGRLQRAA